MDQNETGPGFQSDGNHYGRRKVVVRQLLRIGIAVAILAVLFYQVSFLQVFAALGRVHPAGALAAFLLTLLSQWVAAVRLKILADLHQIGLTTAETFQVNLGTRFYSLFLPGGSFAATAIRVFRLGKVRQHYAGAIMAVAFDRVIATVTTSAVGIVFWLFERPANSVIWLFLMIGVLLGLSIPLALFRWRRTPSDSRATTGISRVLGGRFQSLRLAVTQTENMTASQFLSVFVLSLAVNLLGIASCFVLVAALDLSLEITAVGWIRSALLLAALVPISVSGLGLREGVALLILPLYGIDAESAIAYSLLVFSVTVVAVGLVGGLLDLGKLLRRGRA